MVIFSSFVRVFVEIPFVIAFVLLGTGRMDDATNDYFSVTAALLYIPPSTDIFVYYFFNKNYQSILDGYFKSLFFC